MGLCKKVNKNEDFTVQGRPHMIPTRRVSPVSSPCTRDTCPPLICSDGPQQSPGQPILNNCSIANCCARLTKRHDKEQAPAAPASWSQAHSSTKYLPSYVLPVPQQTAFVLAVYQTDSFLLVNTNLVQSTCKTVSLNRSSSPPLRLWRVFQSMKHRRRRP